MNWHSIDAEKRCKDYTDYNRLVYSIYALDAALVRDTEKKQKDKLLTRTARLLQWAIEKYMGETRKELDLAYIVRSVHVWR